MVMMMDHYFCKGLHGDDDEDGDSDQNDWCRHQKILSNDNDSDHAKHHEHVYNSDHNDKNWIT